MDLEMLDEQGRRVIALPARVDTRAATQLRDALLQSQTNPVIIEAHGLQFLGAAALEVVLIAGEARRKQTLDFLWRGTEWPTHLALLGTTPSAIFTGEAA